MLHWLTYPQHVTFKFCLTTYKCLHGLAPPYLTRFCTPLTVVAGRTQLRFADQHKLFIPRTSTSMLGPQAHRAHLRGMHSLGSFATQLSPSTSSDNPSKPICLTVITDQLCLILLSHVLWALSVLSLHALRDSFCLASVFEMTLLTYLQKTLNIKKKHL